MVSAKGDLWCRQSDREVCIVGVNKCSSELLSRLRKAYFEVYAWCCRFADLREKAWSDLRSTSAVCQYLLNEVFVSGSSRLAIFTASSELAAMASSLYDSGVERGQSLRRDVAVLMLQKSKGVCVLDFLWADGEVC